MRRQSTYAPTSFHFYLVTLGKAIASSYVHTTINLKTSGKEEEEDSKKMSMPRLVMSKIMKPLSFLKLHDQTFRPHNTFGYKYYRVMIAA